MMNDIRKYDDGGWIDLSPSERLAALHNLNQTEAREKSRSVALLAEGVAFILLLAIIFTAYRIGVSL